MVHFNVYVISIVLVLTVLPLTIFSYVMLDYEQNSIFNHALTKLDRITLLQSSHMQTYFQERIFDITATSDLSMLRENFDILVNSEVDSEEYIIAKDILTHNLLRIKNTYGYSEIFLVTLDNTVMLELTSHLYTDDDHSKLISQIQNHSVDDVLISSIHYHDPFHELLFGKLITSYDGEDLGYLLFELHMHDFYELSSFEFEFENTGETVIGNYNDEHSGIDFISPLRYSETYSIDNFEESALPMKLALSKETGHGVSIDYAGNEILASWTYLPLLDIGIVSKQNLDEINTPFYSFLLVLFLITTALIVSVILLSLFFSGRLLFPIKKLKKMADAVSNDNFNLHIVPSGPSEIQSISKSFNHMISTLQEDRKTIDSQIHELEKIDVQKAEFAAMTSHELKTPLVPIQGYCEMLLESGLIGDLNEEQKEFVTKIQSNSSHLRELIERILLVQKLDLGKVNYSCNPVNIKKFMNDVYLDHSAMMNDKQIKFTNSTLVDFDFTFDENKLKEVFTNLIQNSVDFVPNNGKITIDAKKSDDGIVFSVSDNGIGISKEHQNHLFKKFYQVDTSLTREHDGLGLGLSISRSIVEKLGGKIWISSGDESSGISVNFSIPKDVS